MKKKFKSVIIVEAAVLAALLVVCGVFHFRDANAPTKSEQMAASQTTPAESTAGDTTTSTTAKPATEATTKPTDSSKKENKPEVEPSGALEVFDFDAPENTQPTTKPSSTTKPSATTKPTTKPSATTKPTVGADVGVEDAPDDGWDEDEPTTPTQPDLTPNGGISYEEYLVMSSDEQTAYRETFDSTGDFFDWYNAAKKAYDDANAGIDIGDGSINLEDIINGNV